MTGIGSYQPRTGTRRPDADEISFAKLLSVLREEIVRGFLQDMSFLEGLKKGDG